MADRRRRSPEGSSSRRKEKPRSEYNEPPRRRSTIGSHSSASSSSSYIDISRTYPRSRFGLLSFFTAPSERRRLRRRRSAKFFKLNNGSSSSSINEDLAYGTGFVKARQLRRVRSRKGKEIDRERERDRFREVERPATERPAAERRPTTDAEILAVGAGLAKLAREQNKLDMKAAAKGEKRPGFFGAEGPSRFEGGTARGLGPSKASHGPDSFDEDGWESATESESSVDSKLAFGAEGQGGWSFWGPKMHRPLSRKNTVVDPRLFGRQNSLQGIVTEPVGFNDVTWTSTADFGQQPYIPFGPAVSAGLAGSAALPDNMSDSQASLQRVYPMPTADPSRFEAARSSVVSAAEPYIPPRPDPSRFEVARSSIVSGPGPYMSSGSNPIVLQQPQPITPVSQSVYEPIYTASSNVDSLKKNPSSSGRSKSVAEAALFGIAGAAAGAALASDRKDDRKERRRDELRDTRDEDRYTKRRDERDSRDEERYSKRRDEIRDARDEDRSSKRRESDRKETKDERRRDDRSGTADHDERKDKRRDKDRKKEDLRYTVDDSRREKDREKRREKPRDEGRDEKREKRRDERRTEPAPDSFSGRRADIENAVVTNPIDPFQYQVQNDDFPTPPAVESRAYHQRDGSVPTVVTVEREPDFARKRSSSVKNGTQNSSSTAERRRDYFEHDGRDHRDKHDDSRDRALNNAESIYRETEHSTAPIEAAAIGAAVAAVTAEGYRESRSDNRRGERRGRSRDGYEGYVRTSRDRGVSSDPERDAIQEDADRAYREIVMARKIASQVIRSRSPSPAQSVVDKYVKEEEEQIVRIVTPPGMEDHKKKGPYDAPDADFELDHVLIPIQLPNFGIPSINLESSKRDERPLKKDPDAIQPRPFLNLVQPTPCPSPQPDKQLARFEQSQPSSTNDRGVSAANSTPDVVISPKGNIVLASQANKAVTWGENETKHYEVESPGDARDEFVSKRDMRTQGNTSDPEPASKKKGSGWGAVAAGIIGAGVVKSGDDVRRTKSDKDRVVNTEVDAPYEYRGVIVEPGSPSYSPSRPSPPPTGPKPSSTQRSRVPGGFDDDLDFTATVAAGLQDSGFDPNIVIDDPSFRRRNSPPGSNEKHGIYQAPYAETVTDLGFVLPTTSQPVSSPREAAMADFRESSKDGRSASPDNELTTPLSKKEQKKRDNAKRTQSEDLETPYQEFSTPREAVEEYFNEPKLSKKEQKKRDKAAQKQSSQAEELTPFEEPSTSFEIVEEPESYFEMPKKSKKKSKKSSSNLDGDDETIPPDSRRFSVPVDAFDDLRNGEDEWNETKKSKKKSKPDSERYDSPSRSVEPEISPELERSSSKKSKDKSKRKSGQYEPTATEIPLPVDTQSEISRDDGYEETKKSKKSSRDRDISESSAMRSVVSESTARYDDDESRKSKRKSRSGKDDDDAKSVASAPAGDDFEDSRKSKKKEKRSSGTFFGIFGSKSDSGAKNDAAKSSKDDYDEGKKKSKKSKRTSAPEASGLYGDVGAQSVSDLTRSTSLENGNGHHDSGQDDDTLDDDDRTKKDSFLGNAGTSGAGVGLAGVAIAVAAQHHQQSKAANVNSIETAADSSARVQHAGPILDPDILPRKIRYSIDPQYGDLLPVPPSSPNSPNAELAADFPELPESRPDTPEVERLARERSQVAARRALQETPVKSPSQSAVPLKFFMGNRSQPSSPSIIRSPTVHTPATPSADSMVFPRSRPRPTSWDSTKEYKPLYLVESNRRGSLIEVHEPEEELPALPPSQRSSRSSSQLTLDDAIKEAREGQSSEAHRGSFPDPLSIDTALAAASFPGDLLGSEQSTPKAGLHPSIESTEKSTHEQNRGSLSDLPALPSSRASSQDPEENSTPDRSVIPESIAAAVLASSIGYFASSPSHHVTKSAWLDELPSRDSIQRQPSPIDPMTKNRSSYLLQSSPMSRKVDDEPTIKVEESHEMHGNLGEDILQNIDETDMSDVFEDTNEFPQETVEGQREEKLAALAGLSVAQSIVELPVEHQVSEVKDVNTTAFEPVGEFSFTKSIKKDKKKAKKSSKGLSRSSTFDESPTPETSQEVEAASSSTALPAAANVVAADLFDLPQSKEAKRKNRKGKQVAVMGLEDDQGHSKSDHDALAESERDIIAIPTPVGVETVEEFSLPMSKNDKKKNKKKGKTAGAWESKFDTIPSQERPEPLQEQSHDIFEESAMAPAEAELPKEFGLPQSKKDKKGKRKSKSTDAWQPEIEDANRQEISGVLAQSTQKVADDVVTPAELKTYDDLALPNSKKDKKGKKGKAMDTWHIDSQDTTRDGIGKDASRDIAADDVARSPLEDVALDNHDIQKDDAFKKMEDFPFPRSKKDETSKRTKQVEVIEPNSHDTVEDMSTSLIQDASGIAVTATEYQEEAARGFPSSQSPIQRSATADEEQELSPMEDVSRATPDSLPAFAQIAQALEAREATASVQSRASHKEIKIAAAEASTSAVESEAMDALSSSKPKEFKKEGEESGSWDDGSEPFAKTASFDTLAADRNAMEEFSTPLESGTKDDYFSSKSKKDKKGKKKKAQLGAIDEISTMPPSELVPTQTSETPFVETPILGDAEDIEDFSGTKSKKDKKKQKQSAKAARLTEFAKFDSSIQESGVGSSRDIVVEPSIESQDTPTSHEQEAALDEAFLVTGSKKSKKKGKKAQAWIPEDDVPLQPPSEITTTALESAETPIAEDEVSHVPAVETNHFIVSAVAKGKEPLKSSHALELEPEAESKLQTPDSAPANLAREMVEHDESSALQADVDLGGFGITSKKSKKSKKQSRKSQTWNDTDDLLTKDLQTIATPATTKFEVVQDRGNHETVPEVQERETSTSLENETRIQDSEKSTQPTPVGESGAWHTAPATPLATTSSDSGKVLGREYFPSAAGLHSPLTRQPSSEGKSKGYFPSAAGLLPIATAAAAIFGFESSKKHATTGETVPADTEAPQIVAGKEVQTPEVAAKTLKATPDGLAAGYDNEQLSLAKRLQEEFSSGNKRSKKYKSNRRSSSVTPDIEESRSRPQKEAPVAPTRARSLSIGPAAMTEGVATVERGNLYNEDQLELARQMRTEFASGLKKSKKDKNKGANLSQTPLQDVHTPGGLSDSPGIVPAEPEILPGPVLGEPYIKADGLAAGFREDQIYLARQLQAEFGSGKKSKKDKKQRSASQTAPKGRQSRDDYFGEIQPESSIKLSQNETDSAILNFRDQNTTRDGLAAGYNEDQLQLARQLNEEFGSGASKPKKDKRGKRRQSLPLGATNDNFFAEPDVTPDVHRGFEAAEKFEASGASEVVTPAADDDWSAPTKKPKKEKKKARESLVLGVDDESGSASDFGKQVEALHSARYVEPTAVEAKPMTGNDEFAISGEGTNLTSRQVGNVDAAAESSEAATDAQNGSKAATKKSMKDKKKRQSLLRTSSIPPEPEKLEDGQQISSTHTDTVSRGFEETAIPLTLLQEQNDDWSAALKKPKKGKGKTRGSPENFVIDESLNNKLESTDSNVALLPARESEEIDSEKPSWFAEATPEHNITEPATSFDLTRQAEIGAKEETLGGSEEITLSRQSSKKDKKKKKIPSRIQSEDRMDTPTLLQPVLEPTKDVLPTTSRLPPVEDQEAVGKHSPSLEHANPAVQNVISIDRGLTHNDAATAGLPWSKEDIITEEVADRPDHEWGSFTVSKSKKGKKKQKSGLATPVEKSLSLEATTAVVDFAAPGAPIKDEAEIASAKAQLDVDESVEQLDDNWGTFPVKKPKKGKERGASEISTPSEEPSLVVELARSANIIPAAATHDEVPLVQDAGEPNSKLPKQASEEPDDDLSAFIPKKSKKDKRKRASGLLTPTEKILDTPSHDISAAVMKDPATYEPLVRDSESTLFLLKDDLNDIADESGTLKTNKLKDKKKRKSGVSKPWEETLDNPNRDIIEPALIEPAIDEPATEQLLVHDSEPHSATVTGNFEESTDEWGTVPAKKTKKDNENGKPVLSSSLEHTLDTPQAGPQSGILTNEPSTLGEPLQQEPAVPINKAQDEAAGHGDDLSSTNEKSEQDKKQKGGISSLIKNTIGAAALAIVPSAILGSSKRSKDFALEDQQQVLATETIPAEECDDGNALTTKQGKEKRDQKDRKKRASGISTPSEEIVAEPSMSTETKKCAILGLDPHIHDSELVSAPVLTNAGIGSIDEFSPFAVKRSKIDQEGRESIRSTSMETPAQETSSAVTAEHSNEIKKAEELALHSTIAQEPTFDLKRDGDLSQPADTILDVDDEFSIAITKKSKKGKNGKRAPRTDADNNSKSASPLLGTRSPDFATDVLPSITSERVSSPAAFDEIAELKATEYALKPSDSPISQHVKEVSEYDDTTTYTSNLTRKASKKDKRKRQPTVDATATGEGFVIEQPPTLWTDEVEEADVERSLPVIEDIAQDESLSHIPSTTEAVATDDFFQPTKKGKKGKKRGGHLEPNEEASPPETSEESVHKDSQGGKGWLPSVVALGSVTTAASVTGASLLGKLGFGSTNEAIVQIVDDVDMPAATARFEGEPVEKELTKKQKRKASIDRRSARQDDIFDDPALWEGPEPAAFDEAKELHDDTSDRFWSAPNAEDEREESNREVKEASVEDSGTVFEIIDDGNITAGSALLHDVTRISHASQSVPVHSIAVGHGSTSEATTTQSEIPSILSDNRKSSRGLAEQWNDIPEEFIVAPSKKDKKNKKQKVFEPAWTTAAETDRDAQVGSILSQPHHTEKGSSSTVKNVTEDPYEVPQPTPGDEPFYTPLEGPAEGTTINKGASFEEMPSEHSSPFTGSRYNRQSTPALPVVREESPDLQPPLRSVNKEADVNRDSAFVTGSPVPPPSTFADNYERIRDSGVHLRDNSPVADPRVMTTSTDDALTRLSWPAVDEEAGTVDIHKSPRQGLPTITSHHSDNKVGPRFQRSSSPPRHRSSESAQPRHSTENTKPQRSRSPFSQRLSEIAPSRHQLDKSPREHHGPEDRDILSSQRSKDLKPTELHRTHSIHRSERPKAENLVKQRVDRIEPADIQRSEKPASQKYAELKDSSRSITEVPRAYKDGSHLAAGATIAAGAMGFAAARQLSGEKRPSSAQSQRSLSNINRLRTPEHRPDSVNSNRSSGTPPLRRSDRKFSGDLRSLSQRSTLDLAKEAELAGLSASTPTTTEPPSNPNPTANEGRVRAKDMADVYDGFGEGRMGSPRSPTRPHSMRRRQSMQVLELESRLDQLAAENKMLADAKVQAERSLNSNQHASLTLVERDAEIDGLKRTLEWLQNEVTKLTEVNEGLNSANATLARQHNDQYSQLESRHSQATRELQEVNDAHNNLSTGMEGIVKNEVQAALQDKDQEIAQLRAQLSSAQEKIREMQGQILKAKANDLDFLTVRDEDYFDNACQALCQHVQQWVLRFSKFSDMRACRLTSEINNDKIIDRLDNAILDGSDVDTYLADRIKRRDVFMSMTMTMVWEFVFTRYLFGMDREQRQKLKSLEKLLSDVGPAAAVHHWRATTLTLLAKREAFVEQREQDTLAVVNAVMETLTEILPPPSHLEEQIQEQLLRVMKAAVDLSIEMRTQRAEYMMLPPLQPEYDANGDLASKVMFNAALMNERSGDTVSNEELEAQRAVVRIVLFPLVVKKGDDRGEGDEEIVVCPAQVLIAKSSGKKQVRLFSPDSVAAQSRVSMQSSMPTGEGGGENMI